MENSEEFFYIINTLLKSLNSAYNHIFHLKQVIIKHINMLLSDTLNELKCSYLYNTRKNRF